MTTAFTTDGKIHHPGIVSTVNFLLERKVDGLFILGSYGSGPAMEQEERKEATCAILDAVQGRVPVIVHAGAASTVSTVELARHAQDAGAAAVAAVMPYYYSSIAYNDGDIVRHYDTLVKAVTVPVYAYNNPRTTGFSIGSDLLKNLVRTGVKGLKDSCGDYMLLAEFINEIAPIDPEFHFMIGTVGLIEPAFLLGVKSCIAGTAVVFPELIRQLYDIMEQGDFVEASKLQAKVIAIRKIQAITGFRPAACYPLLRMRGVDAGTVRRPWSEPTEEQCSVMAENLQRLGVLCTGDRSPDLMEAHFG
jgi:4-hydroxy-tetrahydrodipicolinate synthase